MRLQQWKNNLFLEWIYCCPQLCLVGQTFFLVIPSFSCAKYFLLYMKIPNCRNSFSLPTDDTLFTVKKYIKFMYVDEFLRYIFSLWDKNQNHPIVFSLNYTLQSIKNISDITVKHLTLWNIGDRFEQNL